MIEVMAASAWTWYHLGYTLELWEASAWTGCHIGYTRHLHW